MRHVGLDFGTTNSAITVAPSRGDLATGDALSGGACIARFRRHDGEPASTFRSIVYFDPHERDRRGRLEPFAGPAAIGRYLAGDGSGRLIQSLKSHVASHLFEKTSIFGRTYTLEDLIAVIVGRMRTEAESTLGPLGRRAVVGRPVRYASADHDDDDALALRRMRTALAMAGFDDVVFEYEPVGAAYHYERDLDHDELVLIADFGGGTSDFCLIRVGPSARRRGHTRDDILATEGVALAGDAFDGALVTHVAAPALGLGSRYRLAFDDTGRTMEVPTWIFGKLRRWHHLSFLKSKDTMELLHDLQRQALEPHKIEGLIHVVQADLGFHLYRAIEATKLALSSGEATRFGFHDAPVAIDRDVTRAELEAWIADVLAAIGAAVDRLLDRAGVAQGDVDRVFMTGGSSLVPAVRRIFAARFGEERLRSGDELTSVALGLALRARDLS